MTLVLITFCEQYVLMTHSFREVLACLYLVTEALLSTHFRSGCLSQGCLSVLNSCSDSSPTTARWSVALSPQGTFFLDLLPSSQWQAYALALSPVLPCFELFFAGLPNETLHTVWSKVAPAMLPGAWSPFRLCFGHCPQLTCLWSTSFC